MSVDERADRAASRRKRIIVCCDGTWMDSLGDDGDEPPSNVTRITRVLRRTGSDGTPQFITYFPGIGTSDALDRLVGGVFGTGLDKDIREAYNVLCTNYVDGDDIVLVGFSRGAFTARSVADMVASVGLLTPAGMASFQAVFDDYENMGEPGRDPADYLVPGLPAYGGEKGERKQRWEAERMRRYKLGLKQLGYTRDTFRDGRTEIRIRALAVWDTVGSLGIPPAPVVGIRGSADQYVSPSLRALLLITWRFTNTEISDLVDHAFQALALDEPRASFQPALWERADGNRTRLKQVWFPGTHANVGGGWYDQQMATITLAWMCDQLASVGVEFNVRRMTSLFMEGLAYSAAHPFPYVPRRLQLRIAHPKFWEPPPPLPWAAAAPLYHGPPVPRRDETERPPAPPRSFAPDPPPTPTPAVLRHLWSTARPWALGQLRRPTSTIQLLAGTVSRRPGLATAVDPDTNAPTDRPLRRTAERVHASARVRLAAGGLGLDDAGPWAHDNVLAKAGWRLARRDPSGAASADHQSDAVVRGCGGVGGAVDASLLDPVREGDGDWEWVFQGDAKGVGRDTLPQSRVLPEEPLVGCWERYLLALTAGEPDIWRWAQEHAPS